MTRAEAFRSLGVELANDRWSWSGRSADGKTVVLGLWTDRFIRGSSPFRYDGSFGGNAAEHKIGKPGNAERLRNLKWAVQECDGRFGVVMLRAKEPSASPREIEEAFPRPEMIMRVVSLDELTGEFEAELVGKSGPIAS